MLIRLLAASAVIFYALAVSTPVQARWVEGFSGITEAAKSHHATASGYLRLARDDDDDEDDNDSEDSGGSDAGDNDSGGDSGSGGDAGDAGGSGEGDEGEGDDGSDGGDDSDPAAGGKPEAPVDMGCELTGWCS